MDLREKVAVVLSDNVADYPEANDFMATADAILAIPEIAEALRYRQALTEPGRITLVNGGSMLSGGFNDRD